MIERSGRRQARRQRQRSRLRAAAAVQDGGATARVPRRPREAPPQLRRRDHRSTCRDQSCSRSTASRNGEWSSEPGWGPAGKRHPHGQEQQAGREQRLGTRGRGQPRYCLHAERDACKRQHIEERIAPGRGSCRPTQPPRAAAPCRTTPASQPNAASARVLAHNAEPDADRGSRHDRPTSRRRTRIVKFFPIERHSRSEGGSHLSSSRGPRSVTPTAAPSTATAAAVKRKTLRAREPSQVMLAQPDPDDSGEAQRENGELQPRERRERRRTRGRAIASSAAAARVPRSPQQPPRARADTQSARQARSLHRARRERRARRPRRPVPLCCRRLRGAR